MRLRTWLLATCFGQGKIVSQRTTGGHRRYDLAQFIEPTSSFTIPYGRVSSYDQKEDLERQMAVLIAYCQEQGWTPIEPIRDLGSGLNWEQRDFVG